MIVFFVFHSIFLHYLNDFSVFHKRQIYFGSNQIVDDFLFDSTSEPAVLFVSGSLVAGLVRGRQSASDLGRVQS